MDNRLAKEVRRRPRGQLRAQLAGQLCGQLRFHPHDQLGIQLWGRLRSERLEGRLWDQLREDVNDG